MPHKILVDVSTQTMCHQYDDRELARYNICTAANGVGEINGSEQTPRGLHLIRAKIGANQPENTVFSGRRPTGEIFNDELYQKYPGRDWILTRIMWLSGLEKGRNRMGNCDTMRRYIYIHGSPDCKQMGVPSSKGCINMRNSDIIKLFEQVPVYTKVLIIG